VHGDITDQPLLERVLAEYEIPTVFHLAAQTVVGVANRNPVSTFDSNIRGTWALLEAARRSPRIEQVVVASSDKAYGTQPLLPYTEDMPLLAVNPYDVAKACADMLTFSYHQVFDVPASVTRCGNFFGPGDNNWNRLVPGTVRALLRGDRPVIRSDGSPIRDYLYVEDGALAYLRLAEAMAADPATVGEAFNFSTESQMRVLDLTRQIGIAVGRPDLEPTVLGEARNEIPHQYLSAKKAATVLGWKPRYSIDEALALTVEWYRSFLTPEGGRS
jgi:CDP-glucose 4,6-dehydratase